ncbi:MAG: hypothetical protein FVQ82_01295 [Planctomycetes bacterium]|nr:hypothetical protein [Planctomycetota bacterium]
MNHIKKTFLVLTLVIIVLSGCNMNVPEEIAHATFTGIKKKPDSQEHVPTDSRKRFISNTGDNSNLGDVRNWTEKYKEFKSKNELLEKLNAELTTDNERLVKRFDAMSANLKITEKELSDANELLIEMRKELDGWKANVLGFREEINEVHKEQLKALVRILKLLGAE